MMSLFHLFTALMLFFHAPVNVNETTAVTIKPVHSVEETEDQLPWSFERKLSWDDFLCEPKRNTDAVALTSTALGITYKVSNGKLDYQVLCSFSKKKSWGLLKTDYILAHEQGHFDITEIYARKLHKALSEYIVNRRTFRQDINEIYNRIVKEKEAFQEAYDGQTDHSRNKNLQKDWLSKIDEILLETEPYAFYP